MRYVCDAPGGKTWFRIETQAEAALETQAMGHAVEKHFVQSQEKAAGSYVPPAGPFIERDIGLKAHIQRTMPTFLTLRDRAGHALVTAMLPPSGHNERTFRPVIVGPANTDPYPEHAEAIRRVAEHFHCVLDRNRCYPYGGDDAIGTRGLNYRSPR
jgi:hypothetical protein